MEVSTLQFPFPLVNLRYTLHEVLLSEVPVSVCNFLADSTQTGHFPFFFVFGVLAAQTAFRTDLTDYLDTY